MPETFIVLSGTLAVAWGWGVVAKRLFSMEGSSVGAIWIGLTVVSLLATAMHLVIPLNATAAVAFASAGAAFCALGLTLLHKKADLAAIVSCTVAVALVALFSVRTYAHYDTGLYHLQAVLWNELQPVTPGLANLHGRFGFNTSVSTLGALFQSLPGGAPPYVASLWVAAALYEALQALFRMFWAYRKREPAQFGDIGWVMLLLPIALFAWADGIPSLSTDIPPFLASIPLLLVLMNAARTQRVSPSDWSASVLLATLLVTQKLSYGLFAGVSLVVITYLAIAGTKGFVGRGRQWIPAAVFSILMLGLWLARGVVLSGYPLYPSTLLGAPVDWRVPAAAAQQEAAWITSWARIPGVALQETAGFSTWIARWTERMFREGHVDIPALLIAVVLLISVLNRRKVRLSRTVWFVLAPFLAGGLYWFAFAPEPRFGYILFWGLAFAAISFLVRGSPFLWAAGMTIAALLIVVRANFVDSPISVATTGRITDFGVSVRVPAEGDRCFGEPLPCTPNFNPALELRGDTLRDGFRVTHP